MYSFFKAALVCFSLLLLSFSATAADTGWLKKSDKHHVQVRLSGEPTDPNNRVRLLLEVQLDPGWKTYWRSPGAGGLTPELKWNSPDIQTRWQWPVPQWFDVAGISTQFGIAAISPSRAFCYSSVSTNIPFFLLKLVQSHCLQTLLYPTDGRSII